MARTQFSASLQPFLPTLHGMSWQTAARGVMVLVGIVRVSVLARLLHPSDFGIFALYVFYLGIVEACLETGINVTLVVTKERFQTLVNTAYTVSLVRSIVIACCVAGLLLAHSVFFATVSTPLFWSVALGVPLLRGLINPAVVVLQKQLRFKRDAGVRAVLAVCELGVVIVLAQLWPSAWILIAGMCVSAALEVLLSFFVVRVRPTRFGELRALPTIFQHAKGLAPMSALSYSTQNIDNAIVGWLTGATTLGFYTNGYALAHKITLEVVRAAQTVLFPLFFQKKDQHVTRQRYQFVGVFVVIGMLALTICIPLMVWPRWCVELILGSEWLSLVTFLPWLAAAAVLQALIAITHSFLIAHQRYAVVNAALAVNLIVLIGGLYATAHSGLMAMSQVVLLSRAIALPLLWIGVRSVLQRQRARA
jgi:O-antigen/teichoic acid export membrane protein